MPSFILAVQAKRIIHHHGHACGLNSFGEVWADSEFVLGGVADTETTIFQADEHGRVSLQAIRDWLGY